MKWIIKRCLLAAPVIMFYSLFSFHAFLISGCSTDTTRGGGGGPRVVSSPSTVVVLSAYSTDTTHGGGGGPRVLYLQTSGKIPAGSTVVLGCTTPGCKLAAVAASTDTTAPPGGVRMLILGTIPVDIPENTNLELRIIPKGDPAMKEMVR
jgi:hypothetical protein